MKFKLFGGLDCPDTLLAQLSVASNTDIVTTKALAALTDHVMSVMLLNTAERPTSVGPNGIIMSHNNNNNTTSSGGLRQTDEHVLSPVEAEVRALTLKFFSDVLKPLVANNNNNDRFDGLAVKAVRFYEHQRLQRAKTAAAAARKYVIGATSAEIEQISLKPATIDQQVIIAEDALSQSLSAIAHVISNIIRFSISDDVLMTELSMLGMAPESVEVILSSVKSAVGSYRDRLEDSAVEQNNNNNNKTKKKGSSSNNNNTIDTNLLFLFGAEGGGGLDIGGLTGVSTATTLRNIGLLGCPRMGAKAPIGSIAPITRTSTIVALQQILKKGETTSCEKDENGAEATQHETEEKRREEDQLASDVITNINEDAAEVATTTAVVQISVGRGGGHNEDSNAVIELSHAQARTLLNELIVAREIMRSA